MIGDDHMAFARALVALARQHNMTDINISFRRGFTHYGRPEPAPIPDRLWDSTIHASWSLGRHGAAGEIILKSERVDRLTEETPDAR